MKYLHFPLCLAQCPIRLNQEERNDPQKVVEEFFSFYDLNSIRVELSRWFEIALGSPDPDMTNPIFRVNLLQFSFQLEALLEAVYALQSQPKYPG